MTVASAPAPVIARAGAREARVCTALGAAAMVGAAALLSWSGRGWFFFYDEWGIVTYRRSGGAAAFLAPHNGHLQAAVIAIYRILFATVGMRHSGAYRAVEVFLHLLCGGLMFLYASRRARPLVALLLTLPFHFLGAGWEVLLWPVNAGFVLPMLALIGCLLLWDLDHPWEPAATAVLLVLAVASSGLGLAVLAGLGVEAATRGHLRRTIEVGAVGAAWAVWFLVYRPSALPPAALRAVPGASPRGDVGGLGYASANLARLPAWGLRSARGALEGIAGTTRPEVAYLLAAGFVVLLAVAGARRRIGPRLFGLAAALVVFWSLTGLARAGVQSPQASRYVYPAALLLLMMVAELAPPRRWPLVVTALAVAAVGLAVSGGIHILDRPAAGAVRTFPTEKSELARIEACRGRVDPGTPIDPRLAPGLTAGPLWAATDQLGEPVPPARGSKDPCGAGPSTSP